LGLFASPAWILCKQCERVEDRVELELFSPWEYLYRNASDQVDSECKLANSTRSSTRSQAMIGLCISRKVHVKSGTGLDTSQADARKGHTSSSDCLVNYDIEDDDSLLQPPAARLDDTGDTNASSSDRERAMIGLCISRKVHVKSGTGLDTSQADARKGHTTSRNNNRLPRQL
jgi:hypothetical protein